MPGQAMLQDPDSLVLLNTEGSRAKALAAWQRAASELARGDFQLLVLDEITDTITEMKSVRHPFDRGVVARAGIDY